LRLINYFGIEKIIRFTYSRDRTVKYEELGFNKIPFFEERIHELKDKNHHYFRKKLPIPLSEVYSYL